MSMVGSVLVEGAAVACKKGNQFKEQARRLERERDGTYHGHKCFQVEFRSDGEKSRSSTDVRW